MLIVQNLLNAFEQLWANKVRSVLTMLGVIIAVLSTLIVVAMVQGFSRYVTNFLEGLGTNAMWVFPEVPPSHDMTLVKAEMVQADINEIEHSCGEVQRVAPYVMRQVKLNYQNREVKIELHGTTPDFQTIRNHYVEVGRCFSPVETTERKQLCVLGREVLNSLRANDDIVGEYITINGKRFRVMGILERKGSFFGNSLDNIVLIPYTTAMEMFPESRRSLAFMAQASSPEKVPEAKAQITTALRRRHNLGPNQPNDFRVLTQDEILRQFNQISNIATIALSGLVGISLLVGGVGITNVMLVSVKERTREIGLRKAVGARRRDILLQFLTEAGVLSCTGGIIGVALGYLCAALASLHPDLYEVTIPFWASALGVGFSFTVGVVFGLLPALKASLISPIDALRYE